MESEQEKVILTPEEDGMFSLTVQVPKHLHPGYKVKSITMKKEDVVFDLKGRYDDEKDAIEYKLEGPPDAGYKMCVSDGHEPYGWMMKKSGIMKKASQGGDGSANAREVFCIPMDMVRLSTSQVDMKGNYVTPWSFYGQSLPEFFCQFQIKVRLFES